MILPVPGEENVEKFKALYAKHMGVELDGREALELATRFLVVAYLGMHEPPGTGEKGGPVTPQSEERPPQGAGSPAEGRTLAPGTP